MEFKITQFIRIKDHSVRLANKIIFSADKLSDLPTFLRQAYQALYISYPKFHKMDELSKLGILGTEILFRDINIPENTACVLSNSSSSLETDRVHQSSIGQIVSPSVFVYTLPNIVMGEISIRNKIYGENTFFISKKFDPELIWEYCESLLRNKVTSSIVCGWIEWNNAEYDVFLCHITREGNQSFSAENLEALYNFENE